MDKGMFSFLLVFVLLIAASLVFANTDQITPAVAQAQAEMSIGTAPVQVIEKGASWLVKLISGAAFAGLAAFVYTEAKKAYRTWTRNSQTRRWNAGPNAQWKQQQPASSSLPRLKREDLMLMAMLGRKMPEVGVSNRLEKMRAPVDEENIDLEF